MENISTTVANLISKELSNQSEISKQINLEKTMAKLMKTGLIKKPVYTLPLVDTIGKTYHNSLNKKK